MSCHSHSVLVTSAFLMSLLFGNSLLFTLHVLSAERPTAIKMAAALILLFTVCLLPGGLCREFKAIIPGTIEILDGSCVTIPCSFDIEEKYDSELDHTCTAKWLINVKTVFGLKTTATEEGRLLGDLTNKGCTTTLNNLSQSGNGKIYMFRLECQNSLKYTFTKNTLTIVAKAPDPPTLSPSTLEVRAGASVTLTCSAPAPCLSLPPHMTWTSGLGDSQETMEDLEDKTQVKTSVLNFTISRLHHKKEISCTATYSKQNGDTASAVSSLTAVVSFPPQILDSSNCTKTPSEVTCSCETEGNPFPTVYWYLDGTRLNQSSFTISTVSLGDTVLKSIIAVSQSHMKHRSTLVCNSSNSLASISHPLYNNHEQQTSAVQGHVTMTVITTLVGLLLIICALLVIIVISTQTSHCSSPKRQSDTSSAALSHLQSSTEANEITNAEEETIYVNIIQIRQADVLHPTSGGVSERLEKNEDGNDVIYSTVRVKSKRNKQQQQHHRQRRGDSTDLNQASSSYALGMETYAEVETRKVENKGECECEYSQVKFKDKSTVILHF